MYSTCWSSVHFKDINSHVHYDDWLAACSKLVAQCALDPIYKTSPHKLNPPRGSLTWALTLNQNWTLFCLFWNQQDGVNLVSPSIVYLVLSGSVRCERSIGCTVQANQIINMPMHAGTRVYVLLVHAQGNKKHQDRITSSQCKLDCPNFFSKMAASSCPVMPCPIPTCMH